MFWTRINARLNSLSNRIDPATQARLRAQIHARVPLPSIDEQRDLQRDNATADEKIWIALHDFNRADATSHRIIAANAANTAAAIETRASQARQQADAARDRLAKIARDEPVEGGLAKPADFDALLRAEGFTASDLRRMHRLGELSEHEFETVLLPRLQQSCERAERGVINALWRAQVKRCARSRSNSPDCFPIQSAGGGVEKLGVKSFP